MPAVQRWRSAFVHNIFAGISLQKSPLLFDDIEPVKSLVNSNSTSRAQPVGRLNYQQSGVLLSMSVQQLQITVNDNVSLRLVTCGII